MTAEVAVMNRLGVALAADSAVTLERGDASKIFQNENKIFELSSTKPIGVMFYNATQFYGVPWEIIIKDFRAERGTAACPRAFDWIPLFCDWLMASRFRPSDAAQRRAVRQALLKEFQAVREAFGAQVLGAFEGESSGQDVTAAIRAVFRKALDGAIADLKAWEADAEMSLQEATQCLGRYEAEFDAAVKERFQGLPLEGEEREKIAILAAYVLKTCRPGPHTTGLVFAGFGDDELFPSLECVELNGVVADRLKRLPLERVDIDRADVTGAVIPFAQRDTADSLLYGRSDEYDRRVGQHFRDVVEQVGKAVIEEAVTDDALRKRLEEGVRRAAQGAVDRFTGEYSREIARGFFSDTLDIVRHMPKQELAAFAEALVSVTSIKRKVMVGPETVGGPIDVAVISKHEGFIWGRRKHYFDSGLNPRYMKRVFGSGQEGNKYA